MVHDAAGTNALGFRVVVDGLGSFPGRVNSLCLLGCCGAGMGSSVDVTQRW